MTMHSFFQPQSLRIYCFILKCLLMLALSGAATTGQANPPPVDPSQAPASSSHTSTAPTAAPATAPQTAPTPVAGYYQAGGASQSPGTGGHLFSVALALIFIVFLIVAVSWFVRRFGQGVFATNSHIKIIATLPLGTRERLLLVDIAGQQLLLGVSAQQVNTLHVFSEPVVDSASPPGPSEFSQKLMALLQAKMPAQQPIANSKNNPSAPE